MIFPVSAILLLHQAPPLDPNEAKASTACELTLAKQITRSTLLATARSRWSLGVERNGVQGLNEKGLENISAPCAHVTN